MNDSDSLEQLAQSLEDLRKRFNTLPVMGISWLYCTNAREKTHQKLLEGRIPPNLWIAFLRMGWIFIRSFQWFTIIGYFHWKFRKEMKRLVSLPIDGIAKTWVYPKREDGNGGDFYYGDLGERLKEKGLSLLLLCGNPTESHWSLFTSKIVSQGKGRIPDLCMISPFRVFQMALLQIGASVQLTWEAISASAGEKDRLLRRILRQAGCDCLRSQTMLNGLNFWIGKRAAALLKPKFFLTLYEGFAWEKCLWKGIRRAQTGCKIVGYQHTVILNRTLELRRPLLLAGNGLPDVVLCSGERTLQMIKPGHEKQRVRLFPFGSFRFPSQGLLLKEPQPSVTRVLVLPEGTLSEAVLLFNVAMEAAVKLKNYSFIFRLHPLLSVGDVKPFLKKPLESLSNVHFSQAKKIEEDFASCSALLYRASSASLYGVLNGLKPYYWREKDEENIDPLFELEMFREEVTSTSDFVGKLDQYGKMRGETVLSAWQIAAKYVQDYTIPVNEKSIQNLMESVS